MKLNYNDGTELNSVMTFQSNWTIGNWPAWQENWQLTCMVRELATDLHGKRIGNWPAWQENWQLTCIARELATDLHGKRIGNWPAWQENWQLTCMASELAIDLHGKRREVFHDSQVCRKLSISSLFHRAARCWCLLHLTLKNATSLK